MKKILIATIALLHMPLMPWTVYFDNQTKQPFTFNVFKIVGDRLIKDFTVAAGKTDSYSVGGYCPTKFEAWTGGWDESTNLRGTFAGGVGACSDVSITVTEGSDCVSERTCHMVYKPYRHRVCESKPKCQIKYAAAGGDWTTKVNDALNSVKNAVPTIKATLNETADKLDNIEKEIRTQADDLLGSATKKTLAQQLDDEGVKSLSDQIAKVQDTIKTIIAQKQDVAKQKLGSKGIKELKELNDILLGTPQQPGVFDDVLAALSEIAGENCNTGALCELLKAFQTSVGQAKQGIDTINANINKTVDSIKSQGVPGKLRGITKSL